MSRIDLEVCVDDVAGLKAAVTGGADRIELCSALALGGLTPSASLIEAAAGIGVPVYAMIRPRAGHFVFDESETRMMLREIELVREVGLAGVVLGASHVDGRLDTHALARLVECAGSLGATLHRAFDLVPEPIEALETAIGLGFERILTSGGAVTATEGMARLATLIAQAAGRISIMPGAGVNLRTIDVLLASLAVSEVHSSCSVPVKKDKRLTALGFSSSTARATDVKTVRLLKIRLAGDQAENTHFPAI